MASKAVKRGLTLSPASWNTIWIRARSRSRAKTRDGFNDNSRVPSFMLPSLTSTRRVSARTKVDLPQPDSPTRPTVVSLVVPELTASTAYTLGRFRGPPERRHVDRADGPGAPAT